jgi:hypothetical protein
VFESDPQEQRTDPEAPLYESATPQSKEGLPYLIRRKGSRYNIFGPHGRIFHSYKSAGVAGPRWEELTHMPWPYRSSAYQSGLRLWQLGLIEREQVGQRQLQACSQPPPEPVRPPADEGTPALLAQRDSSSLRPTAALTSASFKWQTLPLALPAPRIDLQNQTRLIRALRHNPSLLFNAQVRQALEHEVEYHRPNARWAQTLLKLLARYDARQRRPRRSVGVRSETILARHIAWQEQQLASASAPAAHGVAT